MQPIYNIQLKLLNPLSSRPPQNRILAFPQLLGKSGHSNLPLIVGHCPSVKAGSR